MGLADDFTIAECKSEYLCASSYPPPWNLMSICCMSTVYRYDQSKVQDVLK